MRAISGNRLLVAANQPAGAGTMLARTIVRDSGKSTDMGALGIARYIPQ